MPESGPQGQPDEAMIDLLVKQVVEGLSPAELRELDALDSAVASSFTRDFEKAAAAVSLAGALHHEPLPGELEQRLQRAAAQFSVAPASRTLADNVVALTPRTVAPATLAASRARGSMAGWLAAAACLVLAVFFWARTPQPTAPLTVNVTPPVLPPVRVTPVVPAPPSDAVLRDELLARADSIKVTLGTTKDPAAAGVSADVVWDPVTQKGFLHVVGLAANDPRIRQYQAWIFDKERDARYPVDAGVFDIAANATEVVIPIHADVPVRSAAAFAVTVEKAGGTVVSARDHVVALGKVS